MELDELEILEWESSTNDHSISITRACVRAPMYVVCLCVRVVRMCMCVVCVSVCACLCMRFGQTEAERNNHATRLGPVEEFVCVPVTCAYDHDKEQQRTPGSDDYASERAWLAGGQPVAKARFVISIWKSAHCQGPGRLRAALAARRGQAIGPQLR